MYVRGLHESNERLRQYFDLDFSVSYNRRPRQYIFKWPPTVLVFKVYAVRTPFKHNRILCIAAYTRIKKTSNEKIGEFFEKERNG